MVVGGAGSVRGFRAIALRKFTQRSDSTPCCASREQKNIKEKRRWEPTHRQTNRLQLRLFPWHNINRGRTPVSEILLQRSSHRRDIFRAHAETGSRQPDLFDEIPDLESVEVHEFVHSVHPGVAGVGGETRLAEGRAVEQEAEVGVEVG